MGGAAAASANRRKKRKSVIKSQNATKRKMEKRQELASKVFDGLADDSGRLEESKLVDFLSTSLLLPEHKLEPDAVRMVRNAAQEGLRGSVSPEALEIMNGSNDDTRRISFSKPNMMRSFQKYGLYLKKRHEIDSVFAEFDTNQDGKLSREELGRALQERERTASRYVKGVRTELIVYDEDLDFVLKEADAEGDTMISKSELLPALAIWEEVAESRLEEMEKQKMCTILWWGQFGRKWLKIFYFVKETEILNWEGGMLLQYLEYHNYKQQNEWWCSQWSYLEL